MENTMFDPQFSPAELLSEAKRWQHEIKKINMETSRSFISMFQMELPESVKVSELSLAVNTFFLNPSCPARDCMNRLAAELITEIETIRKPILEF